jgi:hypothetical protein
MTIYMREKTQINKIRNEKRDITTNTNEIQRFIREYFENFYSINWKIWLKWRNSYKHYNQPMLNQEDIKHLNSPIKCNEIEAVMQYFSTKKIPGTDELIPKFYQTFKKELTPILLNFFPGNIKARNTSKLIL